MTFDEWYLRSYRWGKYPSQTAQQTPPAQQIDGEEEWEVELVKDLHFSREQLQYLVHWKGFDNLNTNGNQPDTLPMPRSWCTNSIHSTLTNPNPGDESNHQDMILWGKGTVTTLPPQVPTSPGCPLPQLLCDYLSPWLRWLSHQIRWPKHSFIDQGKSSHFNIRKCQQSPHFPTWHHRGSASFLSFSFRGGGIHDGSIWFLLFDSVWHFHIIYKEVVLQDGSTSSI